MTWIVLFHILAAYLYLYLGEFGVYRLTVGSVTLLLATLLMSSQQPRVRSWARVVCGALSVGMLADVLRDPASSSCNVRLLMIAYGLGSLTISLSGGQSAGSQSNGNQSRTWRYFARFCLVLASIMVTLGFANLAMRMFHRADPYRIEPAPDSASTEAMIHQPNDLLKWKYAANFKGHFCHPQYNDESFETNADAYRDRAWPPTPNPDALRVLVLGDSITVGLGVERKENYASLLEDLLSDKLRRKVEVYNASVAGYGPAEQLLVYQSLVTRIAPQVVLALFYDGNDLEDLRFQFFRSRFLGKHSVYLKSESLEKLALGQQTEDWTANQSTLYKFTVRTHIGDFAVTRAEQLLSRYGWLPARGPVNWLLLDSMLKHGPEKIDEFIQFGRVTFARLHYECQAQGAQLFVVRIPALVQTADAILEHTLDLYGIRERERFDRRRPGQQLLELLAADQVRTIDCLPAIASDAHPEKFYFQEGHLSRDGHALVAQCVLEVIDVKAIATSR